MSSVVGRVAVAVAIGGAIWWFVGMPGLPPAFSDEDIEQTKKSIKAEFEKRDGIKVTEVMLLKKSSNELEGFAKLKFQGVDYEITKSCKATMYQDDRKYIWQCQ